MVVAWLFLFAWRGRQNPDAMHRIAFNTLQVGLVLLTLVAFGVLVIVVGKGLLGSPEMFILGNESNRNLLNWFAPNTTPEMPTPQFVTISIWYYRLLMLAWALWLANAMVSWLRGLWGALTHGGAWAAKRST
jgi:hypothetical protein